MNSIHHLPICNAVKIYIVTKTLKLLLSPECKLSRITRFDSEVSEFGEGIVTDNSIVTFLLQYSLKLQFKRSQTYTLIRIVIILSREYCTSLEGFISFSSFLIAEPMVISVSLISSCVEMTIEVINQKNTIEADSLCCLSDIPRSILLTILFDYTKICSNRAINIAVATGVGVALIFDELLEDGRIYLILLRLMYYSV